MLNTTREVELHMTHSCKEAQFKLSLASIVAIVAMIFATSTSAETSSDAQGVSSDKDAMKEIAKVLGSPTKEVSDSPMNNLKTVELDNGRIVYTTTDGEYAFVGDLYGWNDEKFVNLTVRQKNQALLAMFQSLPAASSINYSPVETTEPDVVYVFTDVDCGYCRLLHEHMPEYHANNIEIRYLAYPRAGIGSKAFNKLVSAWCADDRHDVLARVKNGTAVNAEEYTVADDCSKSVEEHYELGQKIEITGTPTNVLPNGKVIPGFTQADQLKTLIDS
ncbi:MAG: DsbC family protein [Gammaproteobacteria bacterium]|nr:DsbC family protein [Gammaproteobacteria bacterium]MYD81701.1 DsbC family protein [Gammaproteobacteria bacterium]